MNKEKTQIFLNVCGRNLGEDAAICPRDTHAPQVPRNPSKLKPKVTPLGRILIISGLAKPSMMPRRASPKACGKFQA